MPSATKVVRIDHAIAIGTGTHGCIETIVLTFLDYAALKNLTTAYECCLYRIASIEKAIDIFGHIDRLLPSITIVLAVDGCNHIGILASRIAIAIYRTSCHSDDQYFVASSVGNNSRIAKGCLKIVDSSRSFSVAHCHIDHIAPGCTMVIACATYDIHLSISRVGTTYQACCSSNQAAVAGCCDAGDTIGRYYTIPLASVVEILLLSRSFDSYITHFNRCAFHLYISRSHNISHNSHRKRICRDICIGNKETAIECCFRYTAIFVGHVDVFAAINLYFINLFAIHINFFKAPQIVIGCCSTVCPCSHEIYS